MDHAFAIPVYGEPGFLEECIQSILRQTLEPRIVLGTSTPSPFLTRVASRYGLEVYVNPERCDIASDWNFMLEQVRADSLTIAHQDDTYHREYLEAMATLTATSPDWRMAFCDYAEVIEGSRRADNLNIRIKRHLCRRAFRGRSAINSDRDKQRLFQLGNPVCCPSVVLNMKAMPEFRFSPQYRTNLDWDAWLRLAGAPGSFLYNSRRLVEKRIHRQSETSVTIANRTRQREDREMFRRLWPRPLAALLSTVYSLGYISNRVPG